MTTFGITGSIACGKSTVTRFLRKAGVPIVDADIIAREVVTLGSPGLQSIVNAFGKEYLLPEGDLDRPKLGRLVFGNQSQLDILNGLMSDLIRVEARRQRMALYAAGHELIGYDAALIIENGDADKYRPLLVVKAPFELQLSRLMSRNALTEDEARNRINKQLSSEEKAKYADFVIETTGTLEELEMNTIDVLDQIKAYVKGFKKGLRVTQLVTEQG